MGRADRLTCDFLQKLRLLPGFSYYDNLGVYCEVTLLRNTFKPLLTWKYAEYELGWSGALLMYSADPVMSRKNKVTKGRAKLLSLTPLCLVILDIQLVYFLTVFSMATLFDFLLSCCDQKVSKSQSFKVYIIFLHFVVGLRHFTTVF